MENLHWPIGHRENRPWTRWWWMGNALTKERITRILEQFQRAGLGGVEVSPIYGPNSNEEEFIPFLSPAWIQLFAHTLREATQRGLGVDLIAGTGWPFGGPWVTPEDSAKQVWVETLPLTVPIQSKRKKTAQVLAEIVSERNRYVLFLAPTEQQVKRAAPGGAGNVLDHFEKASVERYFQAFDPLFATLPDAQRPRCLFNDSWEVFGANATTDILDEFAQRRGYSLVAYLPALAGDGEPDTVRRVRSDYRETIHDLTLQSFLKTFKDWAQTKHGVKIRNQAHGSPGNLLDLYAIADIPETEIFGPPRLALAGLESPRPLPPDFGTEEEALVCRMASSAAHVAGRPLCSSESFTWLGEHGQVTLQEMKAEVDTLFTLGINHLFFHGTPFSPEDAAWPGWLFYATTHCAPTNPLWRDLPALNQYITRCQSLLQSGQPDNDILVYFPFYDLIAGEAGTHDLLQFLTVGRTATWLRENLPDFTATVNHLIQQGWTFDFVSDKQLMEQIQVAPEGTLCAAGELPYRALLIAGCQWMPPETLERIAELAQAGGRIRVLGELPQDVPGFSNLPERRARFQKAKVLLTQAPHFQAGNVITDLFARTGIHREPLTDLGLEFVRRRLPGGTLYFLTNPGKTPVSGWVPLAKGSDRVTLLDPLSGQVGIAAIRTHGTVGNEVYLNLPAGGSILLKTGAETAEVPPWPYAISVGEPVALTDGWQIEFIEGGATLPAARTLSQLSDWTTWQQDDANLLKSFSGTARYTISFDRPVARDVDIWTLELGTVCNSARITLNGSERGTVFARPWHFVLRHDQLKPTGNTLEIEVTNAMANRMAALEREKGDTWRPFLMVNIHYKPFDAAQWEPLPSGLIGPVFLVPGKYIVPEEVL